MFPCTCLVSGVHNHPTLSRIASASKPEKSPSPSDTSHSSTAGDHLPTETEHRNQSGDKRGPQANSEEQSYITHSLKNDSRTKSGGMQPSLSPDKPPLQSPKLKAGAGDPSLPSISILSSDLSSIQPKEASLQPYPFPTSSTVSDIPPKGIPATTCTVRVPSGEPEPSDKSFESTTTTVSESTATSDGNSPPFQRAAPHTDVKTAVTNSLNAGDLHRAPQVTLNDVTVSDIQECTSATSNSVTSSSSSDSTQDGDRKPQLPIKGILKHTAEKKMSTGVPSVKTSRGRLGNG